MAEILNDVENKGNKITRRAIPGEHRQRAHRVAAVAQITGMSGSTIYKWCEETGFFGSGSPSPLHNLCEIIRYLVTADREEGMEVSYAREMAEYPMIFLSQLLGGQTLDGDVTYKVNLLLKSVSDANYMRRARNLEEMTPAELKDFAEKMLNTATLARELGTLADDTRRNMEAKFTGAPVGRERLSSVG